MGAQRRGTHVNIDTNWSAVLPKWRPRGAGLTQIVTKTNRQCSQMEAQRRGTHANSDTNWLAVLPKWMARGAGLT